VKRVEGFHKRVSDEIHGVQQPRGPQSVRGYEQTRRWDGVGQHELTKPKHVDECNELIRPDLGSHARQDSAPPTVPSSSLALSVATNVVVAIGDALPELYCFVSVIRPLNVVS
jgi:hypothetical protein